MTPPDTDQETPDSEGYELAPAFRRLKRELVSAYAAGVAAGRTQAAADIRAEADNAGVIEGGQDLLHWAADIAEGTDHATH